jgi:hypothetical protein
MIVSKLKPCCEKCKTPDVQVDETEFSIETWCTIYCSHYKVCKVYIESEEE